MEITTTTYLLNILLEGSFYLITLIFVVFSLSIAYHLFAYGISKTKALTMLAMYLVVSSILFISMFLALLKI